MGTLLLLLLLLDQKQLDAAVRKAVDHLKSADGELALWALVYADVPDRLLKPRLEAAMRTPTSTTTSAAILALTLEDFDRVKYLARIAHCAQQLIDTQCRDGLWDAGKAVEPPDIQLPPEEPRPKRPIEFDAPKPRRLPKQKLLRRAEGGEKGDPELGRWALWGILAGSRAGLIPPPEVVERAERAWRLGRHDAADTISALSICLHFQGKDWKKDVDVLAALDRLSKEKRTRPKALYGVRTAMLHFDSEFLGDVKWWPRDVDILLKSQREDGSWGDVESTSYAVLTLYVDRWIGLPIQRR
jgi:hypothetical protein